MPKVRQFKDRDDHFHVRTLGRGRVSVCRNGEQIWKDSAALLLTDARALSRYKVEPITLDLIRAAVEAVTE